MHEINTQHTRAIKTGASLICLLPAIIRFLDLIMWTYMDMRGPESYLYELLSSNLGYPTYICVCLLIVDVIPVGIGLFLFWSVCLPETKNQVIMRQPESLDDIVYKYVLRNRKIIASKAATDLRISVEELMESIQRLQSSDRVRIRETDLTLLMLRFLKRHS